MPPISGTSGTLCLTKWYCFDLSMKLCYTTSQPHNQRSRLNFGSFQCERDVQIYYFLPYPDIIFEALHLDNKYIRNKADLCNCLISIPPTKSMIWRDVAIQPLSNQQLSKRLSFYQLNTLSSPLFPARYIVCSHLVIMSKHHNTTKKDKNNDPCRLHSVSLNKTKEQHHIHTSKCRS